jgi:catechol 2,3-dioxygenase-like lactoylglutathione lyase family enzyme
VRTEYQTADAGASLIEPVCLSHGTLECRDLNKTRRFYSEFLGVDVIRHAEAAMGTWCGGDWFIACVGAGDGVSPQPYANRWGLEVGSEEDVDAARDAALAQGADYEIGEITAIKDDGDTRAFALCDLDGNWWEILYRRGGRLFDREFAISNAGDAR